MCTMSASAPSLHLVATFLFRNLFTYIYIYIIILPPVPEIPLIAVPGIPCSRSRGLPRMIVLAGLSNLSLKL